MALFWVFNATGSLPLALAAWILLGILFVAINEGALEPPTRVYFGPRGGAYRINSNSTDSELDRVVGGNRCCGKKYERRPE